MARIEPGGDFGLNPPAGGGGTTYTGIAPVVVTGDEISMEDGAYDAYGAADQAQENAEAFATQAADTAGETAQSNAEAASVPIATVTTSGDLIVATGNGAVTRLAQGANETTLSVSSGGVVGWLAPATWIGYLLPAEGDLLVATAAGTAGALPPGTSGYLLQSNGAGEVPSWAAAPSPVLDTVTEHEVTTTAATAILTYTPTAAGNFKIGNYFRVATATTTVTLTVTWTDAGGAQSLTLVNAASEAIGSYPIMDFMVVSVADEPITITYTAGTANKVFASASVVPG